MHYLKKSVKHAAYLVSFLVIAVHANKAVLSICHLVSLHVIKNCPV